MACLPKGKPFKCPKCTFISKDLPNLSSHYGLSHRVVFQLMRQELGYKWGVTTDESDDNECQFFLKVHLSYAKRREIRHSIERGLFQISKPQIKR